MVSFHLVRANRRREGEGRKEEEEEEEEEEEGEGEEDQTKVCFCLEIIGILGFLSVSPRIPLIEILMITNQGY